MILAWSITESIRYAFYACSLLGFQPKPLLWLRYNTFYILYPLGAGSEAFLMASVLPPLRTLPAALKSLIKHQQSAGLLSAVRGWGAYELFVGFLFVIWWPGTFIFPSGIASLANGLSSALRPVHAYDRLEAQGVWKGQDAWWCAWFEGEEEAVNGHDFGAGRK
jgi:hypothetical protein